MNAKTSHGRLLIVDDEEIARQNLEHVMIRAGYAVTCAASGVAAISLIEKQDFDVVLTDLRMEKVDGIEVMKTCRHRQPDTETILITGYATAESAVNAMKHGAFYYIAKPFRLDEVRKVVAEAMEKVRLKRENRALREQIADIEGPVRIITQDPAMQGLLNLARQVAPTDCSVLISGESGTGKELLARYVHQASTRAANRYVAINCGALNDQLLANELFGHEKGAFTGASAAKKGLIEAGTGGTLFLDEVTEMSPAMQVQMLRVLQEKEVLRLGATRPVRCDIRVIAAANRDIEAAVSSGAFRQDLYFRLNVVAMQIPPLAQRRDDIPLLVQHFLTKFSIRMKKDVTSIAPAALAILMGYAFPGNIRELENVIERGVAITNGDTIAVEHLPPNLQKSESLAFGKRDGKLPTLEEQERHYIRRVLDEVGGNQTAASEILGINRVSLWRKLKASQDGRKPG
jgi:DNA-binding NtrC family response regulator